MDIVFTKLLDVSDEHLPVPASKTIPEWYKDSPSYVNGEVKMPIDGATSGTIKRCMPVFDAITSGYIISTYCDIHLSYKDREVTSPEGLTESVSLPYYQWPSGKPLEFHTPDQAPTYPDILKRPIAKWMNAWGIKTPKGYSCLFIPPVHRPSPISIMAGIVDTDLYNMPVNFPFTLKDPNFTGTIPAGTPIAQVIPFKRDSWTMKLTIEDSAYLDNKKQFLKLKTKIFDSYKLLFRSKKEYN
jgi:hypothetical protein